MSILPLPSSFKYTIISFLVLPFEEYYDYARPDGPPDNGDTQDGMYDVPECEDGTVRPLPEQNYYEEAGAVIQGEETGEAANQERQDTTDDVTANPLYSFAFTGGSGNTPN